MESLFAAPLARAVNSGGLITSKREIYHDATSIELAFCWSHLRRRFVEIVRAGPAPSAKEALSRIGKLYAIERSLRGRTAEERRQGRQVHSKPLVMALKTWFEERLKTIILGSFYCLGGLSFLTMRKWGAALGMIFVAAELLGRVHLVATGISAASGDDAIKIIISGVIALAITVYVSSQLDKFN